MIFVIDKSEFSNEKNDNYFVKQLDLITGLVEKIDTTDIETGKVHLAAVSFNKVNLKFFFSILRKPKSKLVLIKILAKLNSCKH